MARPAAGAAAKRPAAKAKAAAAKVAAARKPPQAAAAGAAAQAAKRLTFTSHGTKEEPCYHLKDVFHESPGQRGKTVEKAIARSFTGKQLPAPTGSEHWRSWEEKQPMDGRALIPKAKEIIAYLRARRECKDDWHINADPKLGFHTKNVNVTGESGGHGEHQDKEEYGRLLVLFFAGNSSWNTIRVGGKRSKDVRYILCRSGDCLVFEGQTFHAVKSILPMSSPFKNAKDWLHNRRISVLLRQYQSPTRPARPDWLKK